MAKTKKEEETKDVSVMEKNLTLVVKEQSLGTLITNAKDIQKFVTERLKEYTVEKYDGDETKAAKDKAVLNNAIKQLNSERLKLEKEFMKPFNEFKDVIAETCNMLKTASNQLDEIVKEKEEIRKADKRKEIEEYWNTLNFSLVKLDQIFNSKWLNKTTKIKDIKSEIDNQVKTINDNLETLGQYQEDSEILKSLYLSSLDLQTTLRKAAELKANRELLAKQEKEKKAKAEESEKQQIKIQDLSKQTVVGTYKVDNTVPEIKPEITPIIKTTESKQTDRIITFYVMEQVANIAKACNLQVLPMKFYGSLSDVEMFKKRLLQAGYSYEKSTWTNSEGVSLLLLISK